MCNDVLLCDYVFLCVSMWFYVLGCVAMCDDLLLCVTMYFYD
jgi:hypothetical protein